ncbi:uncharacterized protein LOC100904862 [Galendromus occidentalis]|uniref:Uncharacterized protein LOC100904862 n=1 Tax=Galendromus occidentalis TaxID=34638 RepID=A0AAJ6VZ29_9ACAR|nr:uncharacterized protein LOC100904862 [Galendromus occidentalis]
MDSATMRRLFTHIALTALAFVVSVPLGSEAIDCFTCTSLNNSNPGCHDPFHPTDALYTHYCMVPKEGHTGRFPAQYCVKLNGIAVSTGVQLTIRVCSLESMDNSCGMFRYQNELMKGCITTCNENGCNVSERNESSLMILVAFISLTMFAIR